MDRTAEQDPVSRGLVLFMGKSQKASNREAVGNCGGGEVNSRQSCELTGGRRAKLAQAFPRWLGVI
jgi:hypothetical protein